MTDKTVFDVAEEIKKTIESGKRYFFAETTGNIYKISLKDITSVSFDGVITLSARAADGIYWVKTHTLCTEEEVKQQRLTEIEKTKKEKLKKIKEWEHEIERLTRDVENLNKELKDGTV